MLKAHQAMNTYPKYDSMPVSSMGSKVMIYWTSTDCFIFFLFLCVCVKLVNMKKKGEIALFIKNTYQFL